MSSFDAQLGAAQAANPVPRGAPGGWVNRPARVTERSAVKTPEAHERRKAELDGFDSGLRLRFASHAESKEYRRDMGVASMTAAEFASEVGDHGPGFISQKSPVMRERLNTNVPGYSPDAFAIGANISKARPGRLEGQVVTVNP